MRWLPRAAPWLLASVVLRAGAQAPPPAGAEAAAFIRVSGTLRAEFKRVYRPAQERRDVEVATGSGFVIAPGGLILTNHHVIAGRRSERPFDGEPAEVTIEVTRIDVAVGAGDARQTLPAAVVAVDPELDLAVLSVTTSDLPYLPFGDSDAVEPGQPTRVLGFPFGRQVEVGRPQPPGGSPGVTVSTGSVSASRPDASGDARFLQTDATVQPGSSGGPMLDAEGYVIGVVHSRLAKEQRAGFAIPVNRVKDFLEANGLLPQLPARRLRLLPPQSFDWKGVRASLPERIDDLSRSRLQIAGGTLLEEGALRIDRIATPQPLAELEQALLAGALDGAALQPRAAPVTDAKRTRRARLGSATFAHEGLPMRVEYALFDLGGEKLAARFLAPAPQVAFNLSVVQGFLKSLEADPLLTREVAAPLVAEWGEQRLRDPRVPALPLPAGLVVDETPGSACPRLVDAPDSLLSASPEGDFTVTLRASFWAAPFEELLAAAKECPEQGEHSRFGVKYRALAASLPVNGGLLRLEAVAPREKWRFVEQLAGAWLDTARRALHSR